MQQAGGVYQRSTDQRPKGTKHSQIIKNWEVCLHTRTHYCNTHNCIEHIFGLLLGMTTQVACVHKG